MAFVFALTVLLSSFLLFQVQPIIGKLVLPWFGGSAAVWTTCLLFFQSGLLLGYAYAHGAVRWLTPVQQGRVHLGLLALSLLALPILPDAAAVPGGDAEPVSALLLVLLGAIGLPYLVLASTSPLLQAWYARTLPERDPYRLFALSNLASLLALLLYPFVFEPAVPTRGQALVWSGAYGLFVLGCGWLAWQQRGDAAVASSADDDGQPVAWAMVIALAAVPSALLLAVTTHLTSDIAPIPLLWVVPLALYLLSFVLVFERQDIYRRWLAIPLLVLAVLGAVYFLIADETAWQFVYTLPLLVATLFFACLVLHGELARRRPAPARLTGYYLAIALGGALGGLAVAVLAPLVFDDHLELPLGFIAVLALTLLALYRDEWHPWHEGWRRLLWPLGVGGVLAFAVWVGNTLMRPGPEVTLQARNFYGTLEVLESMVGTERFRALRHGGIEHGSQGLSADLRRVPTTYYGQRSGVGRVLSAQRAAGPLKVGLIGLGTGTLAAYARAGDRYRIYEINPLVVELARSQFTWLADAEGEVELVMGDARLSLEREAPQAYDLLVVDAFSGDAIPVHLLTREAFALYARHLKPGGLLLVHTSNKYLTLDPIVKRSAEPLGWAARLIESDEDYSLGLNWTSWVVVGDPASASFPITLWMDSHEILVPEGLTAWTDDHSSLRPVIKWPE
jgi:SAM-dependent methyltransferase